MPSQLALEQSTCLISNADKCPSANYQTTDNGLVTESISDAQFTDVVKCKMLTNPTVLVKYPCSTSARRKAKNTFDISLHYQLSFSVYNSRPNISSRRAALRTPLDRAHDIIITRSLQTLRISLRCTASPLSANLRV